jgi:hypothetical protein
MNCSSGGDLKRPRRVDEPVGLLARADRQRAGRVDAPFGGRVEPVDIGGEDGEGEGSHRFFSPVGAMNQARNRSCDYQRMGVLVSGGSLRGCYIFRMVMKKP